MNAHADLPQPSPLTRRRKAAMVVHMMISEGNDLSLSELPGPLQETLTEELGAIRLVDRDTVAAVATEFVAELEAIGLTAPGTKDAAIMALSDHLSPDLANKLRQELSSVRNGDHWPLIADLPVDRILPIMLNESIEVGAVALSKLPVTKAAEILGKTPGDRARRITFAMSQTADIKPDAVDRIGKALFADYSKPRELAFEKEPPLRLGAILNSSPSDTREDVLEGLGTQSPDFASAVRKAIFTFKDIAQRVKGTDIPGCIRSVDAEAMTIAIAAALASDDAAITTSAEFILENISQRMATQMREDAEERGNVKKADAEKAMNEITKAIRDMVDSGSIALIDPDAGEGDE